MDIDDLDAGFGPWFGSMLHVRGWSQKEAGRRIEVSPSLISKWCLGKQRPNTMSCRLIAHAFGLPVREVMVRAGHADPAMPHDDPIKDQLHRLIDQLPSNRLAPFVAVFESIRDR